MESENEKKIDLEKIIVDLTWGILKIIMIILVLLFLVSIFFQFVFANIERNDVFNTPFKETIANISAFPKENISLSNTFIFQDDIDKLIKRYNDASGIEKLAIMQEPLYRKLMEKGLIKEKTELLDEVY